MSAADPRLFVFTRKGLFWYRAADSAGGWELAGHAFLGEPVTMMMPDSRDGRLYAALRHGHFGVKMHRSDDGGETWEEHAAPAYPERPAEAEDDPHSWSLDQVWALEEGGADRPGSLWAGTIPGGLFQSTDGGDSWRLSDSLWRRPERRNWFGGGYDMPGIHSIAVDPRNPDRLHLGVSCGGVWLSEDGGESWGTRTRGMWAEYMPPERREDPTIQDPHRMVACAARPDALWAAHHNAVFRTVDGGERWTEITSIEPSNFGFATAVHPEDSEIAWFAPAVDDECRIPVDRQVVVARTRDGGATFEVLRNGLPQDNAFDLIFRHALEVAPDGDRLAMGSTTGTLWASTDQGDSWTVVSHHLPPIYGVRFG